MHNTCLLDTMNCDMDESRECKNYVVLSSKKCWTAFCFRQMYIAICKWMVAFCFEMENDEFSF